MTISREVFDQQRRPRFGRANPERMQMEFWEWMIRGNDTPPAGEGPLGQYGLMMRAGILKSSYGPYRARDLFQVLPNRDDGPIWTFDRMGQTCTELADGRAVHVGGEHEDYYDPDFNIYNDVVVLGPANEIEIYCYSREAFPPTDFHTASLVGNRIFIVGCLGYPDERHPGRTPVYSLELSGFRMSQLTTMSEGPGWIFEHEIDVTTDGVITVRSGKVIEKRYGQPLFRRNLEEFELDTRTGDWRRLTNRNWLQFSIHREDRAPFPLESRLKPEGIVPLDAADAEMLGASAENPSEKWFRVHACPVSVTVGWRDVEVIVRGVLPLETANRFSEAVRARVEAAVQHRCTLDQL